MKHAKIENSLGCHESAVTAGLYPGFWVMLIHLLVPPALLSPHLALGGVAALHGHRGEAMGQSICLLGSHSTSRSVPSSLCGIPNCAWFPSHPRTPRSSFVQYCLGSRSTVVFFLCVSGSSSIKTVASCKMENPRRAQEGNG